MAEQTEARRMRLMELLAESEEPQDLETLAAAMRCDARTIRRDLDALQRLLDQVNGLEVRRGRVLVSRSRYSPGYFTDQLGRNAEVKQALASRVAASLPDNSAIALTAGSTTYAVAQEIRRRVVEGERPHNLIVFTNSVPSLLELVAAGVSSGVLGEIYAPEDCAFHSSEFRSAFQPSLAIVGASGVLFDINTSHGLLDLYSHRAEEAAFLKQLLANIPEVIVIVDSNKLGRRHPWSFGGSALLGKSVSLVTDVLTDVQREELTLLAERMNRSGTPFRFEAVADSEPLRARSADTKTE